MTGVEWIVWMGSNIFIPLYVFDFVTKLGILFPSKNFGQKLVITQYWCSWSHIFLLSKNNSVRGGKKKSKLTKENGKWKIL